MEPSHRKAWVAPVAVAAAPVILPEAFTADAVPDVPPSVPRLTMPPLNVHENGCVTVLSSSVANPTTTGVSLTSLGRLGAMRFLASVPSSAQAPVQMIPRASALLPMAVTPVGVWRVSWEIEDGDEKKPLM